MTNGSTPSDRRISLEPIRADGWFERFGESISSFHTLCEVLGRPFFAFALIADARISSLMIDRFSPDQSLVEFVIGGDGSDEEPERMTVASFRAHLVERLLESDPEVSVDVDQLSGTDLDALQSLVGSQTLLLAPLFNYRLDELVIDDDGLFVLAACDGDVSRYTISAFRKQMRDHVQDELNRASEMVSSGGSAIDLNDVDAAEKAAEEGDWNGVAKLLGSWPMPLSIYWRTPEGQMLPDSARQRIAEGLGLLGTACSCLGDNMQGEEVLRLAIQYAQDGSAGGPIFARLGHMFMKSERHGEAIAPFRRAEALGVSLEEILVPLAQALVRRGRYLGALGTIRKAEAAGLSNSAIEGLQEQLKEQLGEPLERWRELVGETT